MNQNKSFSFRYFIGRWAADDNTVAVENTHWKSLMSISCSAKRIGLETPTSLSRSPILQVWNWYLTILHKSIHGKYTKYEIHHDLIPQSIVHWCRQRGRSEVCFSQAKGEGDGRWEVGSGRGLKDEDEMRWRWNNF